MGFVVLCCDDSFSGEACCDCEMGSTGVVGNLGLVYDQGIVVVVKKWLC